NVTEQQAALLSLANVDAPQAHDLLAEQMRRLIAGEIPPAVQLELVTAAENSGVAQLQELVAEHEGNKNPDDPMEVYQEALVGGNVDTGRNLFRYHNSAQCVRCHMVGKRGNLVGPDLTDIGNLLSRELLLEALVDPVARIAPGFGRI